MQSQAISSNTPNSHAPRFAISENVARIKPVTPFNLYAPPICFIDDSISESGSSHWYVGRLRMITAMAGNA
jgi:hypothetical protein